MSTIYDVAELAGVSRKTVSRVLNDDRAVKDKTRERVLHAMSQLSYKPHSQTWPLRPGRSNTSIGMLYTDPASGYQSRFHHAMLMASMEAGNYLAIELFEMEEPDCLDKLDRFFANSSIQAMVLLPPLCDYGPLKSLLKERNIDAVLISPMTPDTIFPSVSLDDRQAARDVIDYLLSHGHRNIAHIAGHPDHAAAFLRRQGYYEAYAAAGLPRPSADLVREGEFTFKTAITAAEDLLKLADPPTAIFAANDEMAAAASSVAHRMGIRIPEDLSIIGFDDAPIALAIWPALTTVRQPYLDMAKKAVAILNAKEDRAPANAVVERHIMAHDLVVRDSTRTRQASLSPG